MAFGDGFCFNPHFCRWTPPSMARDTCWDRRFAYQVVMRIGKHRFWDLKENSQNSDLSCKQWVQSTHREKNFVSSCHCLWCDRSSMKQRDILLASSMKTQNISTKWSALLDVSKYGNKVTATATNGPISVGNHSLGCLEVQATNKLTNQPTISTINQPSSGLHKSSVGKWLPLWGVFFLNDSFYHMIHMLSLYFADLAHFPPKGIWGASCRHASPKVFWARCGLYEHTRPLASLWRKLFLRGWVDPISNCIDIDTRYIIIYINYIHYTLSSINL